MESGPLRNVFINQLSLLSAAKSHLVSSLPALVDHAAFSTLKHALEEALEDAELQMLKIQEIFVLLNEQPMSENCLGMNVIIRETYDQILFSKGKNYESDMSVIFYMGVIEHLQIGAARMLNVIAETIDYLPYAQLVTETLDMSADNAELFNLIAAEYIQKK